MLFKLNGTMLLDPDPQATVRQVAWNRQEETITLFSGNQDVDVLHRTDEEAEYGRWLDLFTLAPSLAEEMTRLQALQWKMRHRNPLRFDLDAMLYALVSGLPLTDTYELRLRPESGSGSLWGMLAEEDEGKLRCLCQWSRPPEGLTALHQYQLRRTAQIEERQRAERAEQSRARVEADLNARLEATDAPPEFRVDASEGGLS